MSNDNNENKNKIRRKKVTSSSGKSTSSSSSTRSSNNNTKSKKKKNDKFKFLRVASIVILVLLVVGAAAATGLVFASLKDAKPITKALLDDETYKTTTIKYATGDTLSDAPSVNKKDPVPLDEMSDYLKKAIVAVEDERFYEHNGVDIKGLVRSTVKTLTGNTQGGSTLPMQVSKMLLTSTEKSIPRKIKDIYYAYEMSKVLSKDEVLEVYLNNFFVGRGLVGAEAGSYGYFSKSASELTLAESALLAGITKYPTKYAAYEPIKLDGSETKEDVENKLLFYMNYPDDGFDEPTDMEFDMVDKFYSWGLIPDEATYKQLKSGAMVVRKAVNNPESKKRQEIVLAKMLQTGAITQAEHDEAVKEEIIIKLPKSKDTVASSLQDYIEYEVLESLQNQGHTQEEAINMFYNGGLIINTTIDPKIQESLENEYDNKNNFPNNKEDPNGILQPQSSMVILDYRTGQIKGLVGGRSITGRKGINRATTPQQPGSTIKPLSIYTPAIDTLKITQSTSFSDARGGYKFKENNKWNPKTTTSGSGTMSLRKSISYSSNTIAIKVAEMLGDTYEESIDVMIDYLNNFGITTVIDGKGLESGKTDRTFSALTLGGMTRGISPLEMASAYGTLANGGVYIEPTIITTITTYDGQLVVKTTPAEFTVVSPEVAYVMTDMLQAVVTEGIAGKSKVPNMPVAGKTGTTNESLDVWFAGYTPYYVGVTYIGDDVVIDPETKRAIPRRSIPGGSGTAAKLWSKVMTRVHKDLDYVKFKAPENVYFTKINLIDGGRSSGGSSAAFINGTAPSRYTYQKPVVEEKPKEETPQPETPQPETPQPETPQPPTPEPETPQPPTPEPETPQPPTPEPETPQPPTPEPETPQPPTTPEPPTAPEANTAPAQ